MKSLGLCCFAAGVSGIALAARGVTGEPVGLNLLSFSSDKSGLLDVVEAAAPDNGLAAVQHQDPGAARQPANLVDEELLEAVETKRKVAVELRVRHALRHVERKFRQNSLEYARARAGLSVANLLNTVHRSVHDGFGSDSDRIIIEQERSLVTIRQSMMDASPRHPSVKIQIRPFQWAGRSK